MKKQFLFLSLLFCSVVLVPSDSGDDGKVDIDLTQPFDWDELLKMPSRSQLEELFKRNAKAGENACTTMVEQQQRPLQLPRRRLRNLLQLPVDWSQIDLSHFLRNSKFEGETPLELQQHLARTAQQTQLARLTHGDGNDGVGFRFDGNDGVVGTIVTNLPFPGMLAVLAGQVLEGSTVRGIMRQESRVMASMLLELEETKRELELARFEVAQKRRFAALEKDSLLKKHVADMEAALEAVQQKHAAALKAKRQEGINAAYCHVKPRLREALGLPDGDTRRFNDLAAMVGQQVGDLATVRETRDDLAQRISDLASAVTEGTVSSFSIVDVDYCDDVISALVAAAQKVALDKVETESQLREENTRLRSELAEARSGNNWANAGLVAATLGTIARFAK